MIAFDVQITVSFDETTTLEDVDKLFKVFSGGKAVSFSDRNILNKCHDSIQYLNIC